jgi:hypothetical protein
MLAIAGYDTGSSVIGSSYTVGLAVRSALGAKELLHIESLLSFEHEVDGPSEFMGEDGEGLGFTVFLLEPLFEFHAFGIPPKEEDSGFGEGPLEVGVTDLFARGSIAFPGGFFGALAEPGIGGEVLDPGETVDVVDLVEDDEREDGPDAVDGPQEIEGVGIVVPGISEDVAFEIAREAIEMVDELEIDLDASSNVGVNELTGDTLSMDLVGDLFTELGKVALAIGILDVGEKIGSFACEVVTTPEEIPCGAHGGGIDVSLGQHSGPKEPGDLTGIDSVVFDLGAVDRFHVEGMTEDEGDVFALTEIGKPIPGEHTLDGDDDVVAVGVDDLEERLGFGGQVPVSDDLAILIENTDVHRSRMEIDAAVEWVLLGIESHEASSLG